MCEHDCKPAPASSPCALIAEDELVVAMDVRELLVESGFRVLGIASDADGALAICRAERPCVALLDVSLRGERDGVDLAHALRDRGVDKFVFLTAKSEAATSERIAPFHPLAVISKPFESEEFRRVMRAFADGHTLRPR